MCISLHAVSSSGGIQTLGYNQLLLCIQTAVTSSQRATALATKWRFTKHFYWLFHQLFHHLHFFPFSLPQSVPPLPWTCREPSHQSTFSDRCLIQIQLFLASAALEDSIRTVKADRFQGQQTSPDPSPPTWTIRRTVLIEYVLLHQEILTHFGTQFIFVFIIMLILFHFLFKLFILAFAKCCIIAGVVPHKHFIDTTANGKKKRWIPICAFN